MTPEQFSASSELLPDPKDRLAKAPQARSTSHSLQLSHTELALGPLGEQPSCKDPWAVFGEAPWQVTKASCQQPEHAAPARIQILHPIWREKSSQNCPGRPLRTPRNFEGIKFLGDFLCSIN